MNKPSIIIYRKNQKYRFRLVSSNNETVATSSKGYESAEDVANVLHSFSFGYDFETFSNKAGTIHYFRGHIGRTWVQVLRSEPYASKQKADQGIQAAKECLAIGLVTNLSSESSEVASLSDRDAVMRVIVGVQTNPPALNREKKAPERNT